MSDKGSGRSQRSLMGLWHKLRAGGYFRFQSLSATRLYNLWLSTVVINSA